VVVLWPRLKFSFPQTFEYPDKRKQPLAAPNGL
jgi:hypothetical protein